MWEVVAEVLLPGRSADRMRGDFEATSPDKVKVRFEAPGSFREGLNASGWLDDEVLCAGTVRQGRAPTILGMITGHAAIELLRPRRNKELPREFALAVTRERVVAFPVGALKDSDGENVIAVTLKREERGSWRRGAVAMSSTPQEAKRHGATLEVDGVSFPVNWDGDPSTAELIELLSA